MSNIYIYHIFLIHSSINRHLGCFHILTIENDVAVNIDVCMAVSITDTILVPYNFSYPFAGSI